MGKRFWPPYYKGVMGEPYYGSHSLIQDSEIFGQLGSKLFPKKELREVDLSQTKALVIFCKVKYNNPVFDVRRSGSLCTSFLGNRLYVVVCHCFPHLISFGLNRLHYLFVTY